MDFWTFFNDPIFSDGSIHSLLLILLNLTDEDTDKFLNEEAIAAMNILQWEEVSVSGDSEASLPRLYTIFVVYQYYCNSMYTRRRKFNSLFFFLRNK
jgi:hypothetical protein